MRAIYKPRLRYRTDEDDGIRRELTPQILAEFSEGSFMQGSVFFHYGKHTRIGKCNFFNYNLTVQDDAPVTIGNDGNFDPNSTIVTPRHLMRPKLLKYAQQSSARRAG